MARDSDLELDLLRFVEQKNRVPREKIASALSSRDQSEIAQMTDFLIDDGYLVVVESDNSTRHWLRISSYGERRIREINLSQNIGF